MDGRLKYEHMTAFAQSLLYPTHKHTFCRQNDEYMALDDIDMSQMPTSEEIFGKSYEEFKREY